MSIQVCLVYSPGPREVVEFQLELADDCTVLQALRISELMGHFPETDISKATVGIWGRKASPGQALRDQDRIEIYRPLMVDPKVARRERFAKQGANKTGLFAKKRVGAKAGY